MIYTGIEAWDELGGGLNNLLMNLAQLLHDSCKDPDKVLVLPQITSGWRFFKGTKHTKKPLKFSHLFNASFFIESVRPCVAVEEPPAGTAIVPTKVQGIRPGWPYEFTLPALYAALRPSPQLEAIVSRLFTRASSEAGPRWSGVHLRIERDWWFDSGFCNLRRYPVRRCYPPSEVAAVTRAHRHRRGATGTVLFYAEENVSRRSLPA